MRCSWYVDNLHMTLESAQRGPHQRPCANTAPSRPNYPTDDPVFVLCAAHLRMIKQWELAPPRPPRLKYGEWFVYFLLNRSLSQIKIGHSQAHNGRIQAIRTQAGIQFPVLALIPETDLFTESLAHHQATHLRLMGEWFEATDELYEWIDALTVYTAELDEFERNRPPTPPKLFLVETPELP